MSPCRGCTDGAIATRIVEVRGLNALDVDDLHQEPSFRASLDEAACHDDPRAALAQAHAALDRLLGTVLDPR
ncbi:hypothetical protein [Actinomyces slackii]|uniref:hypothetical protein n=1 Tax=Actinomyces slackii TaxID=52774 RepID=UPI0039E9EF48